MITLTSEQFQELFMTCLGREDAQEALWSAIANARIEDGDAATLAWQRSLAEVSPQERTERVGEVLSSNPAVLEGRVVLSKSPSRFLVAPRRSKLAGPTVGSAISRLAAKAQMLATGA